MKPLGPHTCNALATKQPHMPPAYLCLRETGAPAAGAGVAGEQRVGELQGGGGSCSLILHQRRTFVLLLMKRDVH